MNQDIAEPLDLKMMQRCLELARMAEGRTSPNPMVGAVVLDPEGAIVGEGFHPKAGLAHAEVFAFEQAKERSVGGTLYVNLEPCSHFGRTPPCADRVIESKVSRVVIGMEDPNPKVSGQGIQKLRESGIKVDFSSLTNECRALNRAFIKSITEGMPWLTLKMASTLDGRIADRNGKSRWISGPEARTFVQSLRNTIDCVLVGGTTAFIDDPELNVREIDNGRDPHRAVIDPTLHVLPRARLCKHKEDSDAWTALFYDAARVESIPDYPERVKLVDLAVSDVADGPSFLRRALRWLQEQNINSVLCEGGGRLAAALLSEKLVDEVCWIVAPKFLLDSHAVPSLAGPNEVAIADCFSLENPIYTQLGQDILVQGKAKYS